MRITDRQLRQIIKEELSRSLREGGMLVDPFFQDLTFVGAPPAETSAGAVAMGKGTRQNGGYGGPLPDRPMEQVKRDFKVANNALTGARFVVYNDQGTERKFTPLSWLDASGNAPMTQNLWGAFADNVTKSYRYIFHPGDSYMLTAVTNLRAGKFLVEVIDKDGGKVLYRKEIASGDDSFSDVSKSGLLSVDGKKGERGHEIEVKVTALGVPRSDLILGQVLWDSWQSSSKVPGL
jgi:hypothetical protein